MENLDRYVKENSRDLNRQIKKFENPDFLEKILNIMDEESKKRKFFISNITIAGNYIKVIGGYGIKDESTFEYDFYIDSLTNKDVLSKLIETILINSYKKKECSIFDITYFNERANYELIIVLKNGIFNSTAITLKYSKISELLEDLELLKRKAKEFSNYELENELENLDEGTLQKQFIRGPIKLRFEQ